MKRIIGVFLCACCMLPGLAAAKAIPATLKAGETDLILNGSGIRNKLVLDIYEGALYLPSKSSNSKEIINADKPMAVRMVILSNMVKPADFNESTQKGFVRSAGSQLSALQPRINRMKKVFENKISKGDVYDMIYIPGKGTLFYKNGQFATQIEGLDFKKALFGTWLIDKPAHGCPNLRGGMLGLR